MVMVVHSEILTCSTCDRPARHRSPPGTPWAVSPLSLAPRRDIAPSPSRARTPSGADARESPTCGVCNIHSVVTNNLHWAPLYRLQVPTCPDKQPPSPAPSSPAASCLSPPPPTPSPAECPAPTDCGRDGRVLGRGLGRAPCNNRDRQMMTIQYIIDNSLHSGITTVLSQ